MELFAIDDHHLAVVADQIVGSTGDRNSAIQKAQLQLAQVLLASAIGKSDQRINCDATFYRVFQSLFDLHPVEAEDDDLDRALRPLNGFHQRLDSIPRLNKQLHATELLRAWMLKNERRANTKVTKIEQQGHEAPCTSLACGLCMNSRPKQPNQVLWVSKSLLQISQMDPLETE